MPLFAIIFILGYICIMGLLGYIITTCFFRSIKYFFFIYLFIGALAINFLLLSCNPLFYNSKEECSKRFFIFNSFNINI